MFSFALNSFEAFKAVIVAHILHVNVSSIVGNSVSVNNWFNSLFGVPAIVITVIALVWALCQIYNRFVAERKTRHA